MQRPRGGPVWIERAIDHSPLLVNLFSGEPVCANIQPFFISRSTKPSGFSPSFFQVTQNPQGSALLYFKKHKTLRVQPYFFSRIAKPSGFSPSFFQVTQNPQGSALLFFKQCKTLRVQPYFFSSDTKPSGFSPSFFQVTQNPQGPALLFFWGAQNPQGFSPTLFQEAQNPQGSALLFFKERKTLRVQPHFFYRRNTAPRTLPP